MKAKVTLDLLNSFLNNTCTPEESERVKAWYNSFEGKDDPLELLSVEEREAFKRIIFQEITTAIHAHEEASIKKENTSRIYRITRKVSYSLVGIAATVLLLVMLKSVFIPDVIKKSGHSTIAERIVLTNGSQSIQRQKLPDGTLVWLNPHTILEYPRKFKANIREIKMSGEAFFEVTKDRTRPFVIHSGGLVTQVLGTSFRIRNNAKISSTEVSVVTGKVSVQISNKEDSEIYLLPKQKAVYSVNSEQLKQEIEETPALRIWSKVSLVFDNTPLPEVIKTLNERFGVRITVGTEGLLDHKLNGDFTDQNLPDILEMLNKSLKARYDINGLDISINKISTNLKTKEGSMKE